MGGARASRFVGALCAAAAVVVGAFALSAGRAATAAPENPSVAAVHEGVASCAGSSCHSRQVDFGRERPPERTDHLAGPVQHRRRPQPRLQGPVRRPRAGHRPQAGPERGGRRTAVPGLPCRSGAGLAARREVPALRRRQLRVVPWRRAQLAGQPPRGGRHACRQRGAGHEAAGEPQGAGRRLPRLPLLGLEARPVRDASDHGRRPPARRLRTRPVLQPAAALGRRRRLCEAQGLRGRCEDLGGGPGHGAGTRADASTRNPAAARASSPSSTSSTATAATGRSRTIRRRARNGRRTPAVRSRRARRRSTTRT